VVLVAALASCSGSTAATPSPLSTALVKTLAPETFWKPGSQPNTTILGVLVDTTGSGLGQFSVLVTLQKAASGPLCPEGLGVNELDPLHPDALTPVFGSPDGADPVLRGWITYALSTPAEGCQYTVEVDYVDTVMAAEGPLAVTTTIGRWVAKSDGIARIP
jgi:hypothetical protein